MTSTSNTPVSADLRKILDAHGYGFQYAVMRRGEQLHQLRRSRWELVGTEFPVCVGTTTTHVDFVYVRVMDALRTYLVAECKRVDPKRGRWCFARAPYTWFNPDDQEVSFDELQCESYDVRHRPRFLTVDQPICHLGRELRTDQPGDGTGSTRAIDEAVGQVLRGASGLIDLQRGPTGGYFSGARCYRFIPAIFTTAEIWVTDADLGAADLRTGLLPKGIDAHRKDWIWLSHNRSPAISPPKPTPTPGTAVEDDPRTVLRSEFARSIAVISTDGIDDFLSTPVAELLERNGYLLGPP